MKSSGFQNAGAPLKKRVSHPVTNAREFDSIFRQAFRQLRSEIKISQLAAAKIRRLSQQSISNIETGKTNRLSLSGVYDLAMACDAVVTIKIDNGQTQNIIAIASDKTETSSNFEASLLKAINLLHKESGTSGSDISRDMKLSPGTISKIKNGSIALNLLHFYSFVDACGGEITAQIHDKNKNLIFECSSIETHEKPASQFGSAARDALQKLRTEKIALQHERGWNRHSVQPHGEHREQKASAQHVGWHNHHEKNKTALPQLGPDENRSQNTDGFLSYLRKYNAEVLVTFYNAHGQPVKEFSSAGLSPSTFNVETRQGISSLRQGRELSPVDAARRLNVGPTAVRTMESSSKDYGLRWTAVERYAKAYDGWFTLSIHNDRGNLVAEISSAKRPQASNKKASAISKGEEPDVK